MKHSIVVFFEFYLWFTTPFSAGVKVSSERSETAADKHELIRQRRTFGSKDACPMEHGVYLERWDRIDYKRVKFLLNDPRYPNLPSFTTCVPTFEQPSNWGDFFGSRLRTYFVPLQTGNHYFYISSNAGSDLFLSKNEKPDTKTPITGVDGGFPSHQYEYDRYTSQKSLPIHLVKGKPYYMEAIMKDDHQKDHLEAALQTPDGKFYKVIPSMFLWTTLPVTSIKNATVLAILVKAAARAGAAAGSSFGERWAMKSGAKAGAKAGAMAGMEAGASAGANAAVNAAVKTMKKTLEDALNTLHGDSAHKFNIVIKNGSVVAVTGPGMEGASAGGTGGGAAGTEGAEGGGGGAGVAAGGVTGVGGTAGTAGTAGTGGTAGTTGIPGTSGGGGGGGGGGGAEAGAGAGGGIGTGGGGIGGGGGTGTGGAGGGAEGGGGGTSTSTEGTAGAVGGVAAGGGGGITAGGSSSVTVSGSVGAAGGLGGTGGGAVPTGEGYTEQREVTYILKPGQDPQTVARALVWRVGGASKLVDKGLYTVHSYNAPYEQENGTLNFCWQAHNGELLVQTFCQVFKVHIPGLYASAKDRNATVSFESVCFPGFYIKQKNYHFVLEKRDGSSRFDKETSFTVYSVMKYTRNLMLQSMHKDWYICQSEEKTLHGGSDIVLDFYDGDPDVLGRCTFLFHPISQNDNKFKHCRLGVGPMKHPMISGQPLPHPAHLIPYTPPPPPALPSCIPVCSEGTGPGEPGQPASVGPSSPVIPAPPGTSEVPIGTWVTAPAMKCVAINFINNVGSPFKLYSSLKHEAYLVIGSGFKLKLIIERPELHSHVTFFAEDLLGKHKMLLNGEPIISAAVIAGCPEFLDVFVTEGQGILPVAHPYHPIHHHPAATPHEPSPPPAAAPPIPAPSPVTPPASPPVAPSPPAQGITSTQGSPAPGAANAPPSPASPALPPPPSLTPVTPSHPFPAPAAPPVEHPHYPPAPPPPAAYPPAEVITTSLEKKPPAVHYHYHYASQQGQATNSDCPSMCRESQDCYPTCPLHCCRDFNKEEEDDISVD